MESIVQIRQMMAEQKFLEAQRLIEVQLALANDHRHELLLLSFQASESLDKSFPIPFRLELAELESQAHNHEFVLELISKVDTDRFYLRVLKLKLHAAEARGQVDKIYKHLSDFYYHQFEKQIPNTYPWVNVLVEAYFKNDFNLRLTQLALFLQVNDLMESEKLLKKLIISCVEKSSPKGTSQKLSSIVEVLKAARNKCHLEIYQSFCLVAVNGIQDKSDYKRLVEMVIFFEDFKFQVLTLKLLDQLKLSQEALQYAQTLRDNSEYDFVYFDKYFPGLKKYFIEPLEKKPEVKEILLTPEDLQLDDDYESSLHLYNSPADENINEAHLLNLLKYQTYTPEEYCDLAVSFLQSEMPRVAIKASELAILHAKDDKAYLKGSYLKLTCLLLMNDNRAALDTCLEALKKSDSPEDVLSFLYGQAEALIRLGNLKEAKKTLSRVLSINPRYRMARERLEKL